MSIRVSRALDWISLRSVLGSAIVAAILVVCGKVVDGKKAKDIFLGIAVIGLLGLAAAEPGAFLGVMVLAAMNGLPVIDTSKSVAAHVTDQDVVCLVLVAVALVRTLAASRSSQPTPRIARTVSWCGLALLVWCAFTVLRTWDSSNVSLLASFRFGRDFVYFGALLMVLPRLRLRERDVIVLVAILTAGVCVFSVGQFLTVEGIANPKYIVHAAATAQTLGLTRVYAPMNDLLLAGVAIGIGTLALARNQRYRRLAIPVTALLTTSLVVELTRARWIALILSVVLIGLWLALQGERQIAVRVRKRIGAVLGAGLSIIVVLLLVAPNVIGAGRLGQRLLSIFTDIGSSSSTSTLEVRQQVANVMISLLGGKWPIGLGLIPPSAHYYQTLPTGSLRDPDVGVLNAVMTIGVIGALLIYLPLIVVLVYSLRRVREGSPVGYSWLTGGGQIWIVASIVSSITLITLFSVGGLVMAAAIVMLLCQPVVSGSEAPARAVAPGVRAAVDPAARAAGAPAIPLLLDSG